jgi:hypothetical protein
MTKPTDVPLPSADELRAIKKDLDEREKALNRIGRTPFEKLSWLVDVFAREDLDKLRPEVVEALGYDLRALNPPVGFSWNSSHEPLRVVTVKAVQKLINEQLRALLADDAPIGERIVDPSRGWRLPPAEDRMIRYGDAGSPKFAIHSHARNERVAIVRAIAHLVVTAGHDLRACLECGRPFMRRQRQIYCDAKCSQKARIARRPR